MSGGVVVLLGSATAAAVGVSHAQLVDEPPRLAHGDADRRPPTPRGDRRQPPRWSTCGRRSRGRSDRLLGASSLAHGRSSVSPSQTSATGAPGFPGPRTSKMGAMTLPLQPPSRPDAGQAGRRDPRRRGVAVRAEVGRVPLHRVPRRRRHRAGQPQRAAVHPLLPRAARPAARRRCPTRAWSTARSSCPRPTTTASTSTPCCSGSIPPSPRVRPARRRDAGARSSPSTSSPIGDESLLDAPLAERHRRLERRAAPRRRRSRSTSARAPPTPTSPVAGSSSSRAPASTASIAKRLADPYTPDKRTLVKVKHRRTADCVVAGYRIHKDGKGVGSLLLGLYDDEGRLHHVGVVAGVHASSAAPSCSPSWSR